MYCIASRRVLWPLREEERQSLLTQGRVRGMMLPSSPPLRTARVNFFTYGSSLWFRPCVRTRLLHRNTLVMNLLMTGRVKQHAVFCAV